MKKMSYAEAIREGMSIRMREDPNVLLFGEDVGAFGGCFGVTACMFNEFGDKRVRDTPISEGAIIGAAVGSAGSGMGSCGVGAAASGTGAGGSEAGAASC